MVSLKLLNQSWMAAGVACVCTEETQLVIRTEWNINIVLVLVLKCVSCCFYWTMTFCSTLIVSLTTFLLFCDQTQTCSRLIRCSLAAYWALKHGQHYCSVHLCRSVKQQNRVPVSVHNMWPWLFSPILYYLLLLIHINAEQQWSTCPGQFHHAWGLCRCCTHAEMFGLPVEFVWHWVMQI